MEMEYQSVFTGPQIDALLKEEENEINQGLSNIYPQYLDKDCVINAGSNTLSRYDISRFVKNFWIEGERQNSLDWYFGLIQVNTSIGWTIYVFSLPHGESLFDINGDLNANYANLTALSEARKSLGAITPPANGIYSCAPVAGIKVFADINWEYICGKFSTFGNGKIEGGIGKGIRINQSALYEYNEQREIEIIKGTIDNQVLLKISDIEKNVNILDGVMNDNCKTIYADYDVLNWYTPYNSGYVNYPSVTEVGQYVNRKLTDKINTILAGPLKRIPEFGGDCKYRVYVADNLKSSPEEADKTLIQSGVLNSVNTTTYKQYEITLSEDLKLNDKYIFVYIEGVILLGRGSGANIPEYPGTLNRLIFKLNDVWNFGYPPSFTAMPLLLQYKDRDAIYPKSIQQQIKEQIEGINVNIPDSQNESINISLPDKLYAVVGDTFQLFFRGCIQAVNPYNYNILVSCAKGAQYPRYFEYTPTADDVGNTSFNLKVTNNSGVVLGEKNCTIVTVPITLPSVQKNILCFGDSLTTAGIWCAEAYRRLTGDGGNPVGNGLPNIAFCGSKNADGVGYFGAGGWAWSDYITKGKAAVRFQVTGVNSLSIDAKYVNNGITYTIREINVTGGDGSILCAYTGSGTPETSGILTKISGDGDSTVTFISYSSDSQNPLWDYENNKMTFIPYANKYCNGKIDYVYTLLSWNGLSPWKTDFDTIKGYVRIFADTLHSEFPQARLKVLGIQVNSINGGMGANYGATGTSYADTYGNVVIVLNLNKAYQEVANEDAYRDFVEFVNVSSQFDSENNMPQAYKSVNTRSYLKEYVGTNGVHPSMEGYYQIADVVYRNIVANCCQ